MDCLNSNDGINTTKLIKYSTNNFKSKNYLMLNISKFFVFNKETKNASNEKLTKKSKNFGQFTDKKKNIHEKKIFKNLIGRNR